MQPLKIGRKASVEIRISSQETAEYLKTGRVPVYATPAMIRLMEEACVVAVDACLPEGKLSVGASLEVRHLAPTPVGAKVRAEAELADIEGRWLTFQVRAYDEKELIGEGTHVRVIVDRKRFCETYERKLLL